MTDDYLTGDMRERKFLPLSMTRDGKGVVLTEDMLILGRDVPKGFYSDGASIPPILRGIYPKYGRYLPAVILHDFECENLKKLGLTRKHVDLRFKRAMILCGVKGWRVHTMYAGVRSYAIAKGIK